jgi:hypothetical protein
MTLDMGADSTATPVFPALPLVSERVPRRRCTATPR